VNQLQFILAGTLEAAVNAVGQNQGDVVPAITSLDVAKKAEALGLKTLPTPSSFPNVLWVPDHDGKVVPELGEQDVRTAMALAVDAVGYNSGPLGGWGTIQNQLAYKGNAFWFQDLDHLFSYDLAKAKALMKGRQFSCSSPEGSNTTQGSLAEYVKSQLAQIGITLKLDVMPSATYRTSRLSGNYPCVITTLSWTDPASQYDTFFRGTALLAKFGPMPADIEALATRGASTTDLAKRLPIYHELFKKLLDAHYLTVFYVTGSTVAFGKGVTGIVTKGQVFFPFDPRGVAVSSK
jgi:ABC-type transport system substrate-binding protein